MPGWMPYVVIIVAAIITGAVITGMKKKQRFYLPFSIYRK